jgi:hypothetical protein
VAFVVAFGQTLTHQQRGATFEEIFDVGTDTGTAVDDKDCQVPFRFTGKLNKLTIEIEPPVLTLEDVRLLQEEGPAGQLNEPVIVEQLLTNLYRSADWRILEKLECHFLR